MVHTKIRENLLLKILTSHFTKRQLKLLLLLLKLSHGQARKYVSLRKKDLKLINLSPSKAEKELRKLILRNVLKWNPRLRAFRLNSNLKGWIEGRKVKLLKE